MTKPTDPMQEIFKNRLIDEISQKTNAVFDSLVTAQPKAKLPEDVFKYHFLPYFSGQEENSKTRNITAEWVGVAGTPMAEVDVVDKAGKVLFTVPPLFDTSSLNISKRPAGRSLADITNEFNLINHSVPVAASRFLNNALTQKGDEIIGMSDGQDPGVKAVAPDRWLSILNRYGFKSADGAGAAKPTQTQNSAVDDLIYD